ncbi:MAG: hypothetical protein ABFC34_00345 [Methanobacterium sp.]
MNREEILELCDSNPEAIHRYVSKMHRLYYIWIGDFLIFMILQKN